ncbi:MAG TPA: HEAT repeat domain-containing protein [Gemmataceae bacterium]|nr:HEAT repeat domain-containing protein [Gemmataceae bacterium]
MDWRTLLSMTLWLACMVSSSQAGIIFNRKKPPASQDQVAALLQTLHSDPDERHRASAAEALAKIDPNSNPNIVPTLEEAAKSDASNHVRDAARATLTHYFSSAKPGQPGSKTPQTEEPPFAARPTPLPPPPINTTNRSTTNSPTPPRANSRPPVRESAEPPLATNPQPQTPAAAAARSNSSVIARSPSTLPSAVTDPKPMVVSTGPVTIKPPVATNTPAAASPTTSAPLPSTPATTITPKFANPAAQTAPVVRPPVIASSSPSGPPPAQTTPSAPATKVKPAPTKPEEDGPVLNPPG